MQFKLDLRLARLLGIHTQTRPVIINALWQYIKTHRLQDPNEREYINCDKYLEQVLGVTCVVLSLLLLFLLSALAWLGSSGHLVRGWANVCVLQCQLCCKPDCDSTACLYCYHLI